VELEVGVEKKTPGERTSHRSKKKRRVRRSVGLHEEVEEHEEKAEKEEEGAPGKAATRELRHALKYARGNDAETRFAAALIKRTRGHIAGKISTEERELVVQPEDKLFSIAPQINGTEKKRKIP